jgi:hypothetical protein
MTIEGKRQLNEKKFPNWEKLPDGNGNLIEIHEKFPVDKGHRKVKRDNL